MNRAFLRAFHAVAEHGSFTRAATAAHLTQPTLSGHVKALEETYGVKLFERRGRGIELTDIGVELHALTSRLFSLEEEAQQLLTAARGLTRGSLRVAGDAPTHIALLARFGKHYPEINMTFRLGNSEQVRRWLLERRADIGVIPDVPADDPDLCRYPYRQERLVVFVPVQHRWAKRFSVNFAELEDQPLVLREQGSHTRALLEETLDAHGIRPREMMEIGSREAVREAVASGLGISVVVESELGQDDRLARLPFADTEITTTEYIVCLHRRRQLPVVKAFLDEMAAVPSRPLIVQDQPAQTR